MRSKSFEQVFGSTIEVPSDEDNARARIAQVRRRLAEIHRSHHKAVTSALKHLGEAVGEVGATQARLEICLHAVREADRDHADMRALSPAPGGLPPERHSRSLGLFGLLVILSACVIGDYLVDRGSMLVFRLPLAATEALAAVVAVIQTLSAHTVGRLLRRQSEAPDPGALASERTKMRILVAVIGLMILALAAIRAARGDLLFAALVLGLGSASAVVATAASYLHANTLQEGRAKTGRKLRAAGNEYADTGQDLGTAEAKRVAAIDHLQAVVAGPVAEAELACAAQGVSLANVDLEWLTRWSDWSAGRNLPIGDRAGE